MDELFEELKLTDRQNALVNLLLSEPDKWFTQEEIVAQYPALVYSDGYKINNNPKAHDKCSTIWSDVNDINNNGKVIIAVNKFRYKCANELEAEAFISSMERNALKKLKRASTLRRYYRLNGQGVLGLNGAVSGYKETIQGK